jgi:hypothetical protein
MLLQIRRPARPEPRPLRERADLDSGPQAAGIWLSVRPKRSRASPGRKTAVTPRGPLSAPNK